VDEKVWSAGATGHERRRFRWQSALFGLAVAFSSVPCPIWTLGIYAHAVNVEQQEPAAAFGAAVTPLILAVVGRGAYAALRRHHSPAPRFLSGWLLVLATGFAFVLLVSQSPSGG